MWMLKETIAEKALTSKEFNSSKSQSAYSFSVKNGQLAPDNQLSGTIEYDKRQAIEDLVDAYIDMFDFYLQTYLEAKSVKEKGAKIVKDAVESRAKEELNLTNEKDYIKKWIKKVLVKLRDSIIDETVSALHEINKMISENEKKEILSKMRDLMAVELAETASETNGKAITYLQNVYGEKERMP